MSETSDEFWSLVDAATKADDHFLDTRLIEPYLIRVLEFVQSRPAERQVFVRHFVALATSERSATPYLVPFCMRSLRYPEVLEAVTAALSAGRESFHDLRKWPLLTEIREAYADSWPDAELFPFYSTRS